MANNQEGLRFGADSSAPPELLAGRVLSAEQADEKLAKLRGDVRVDEALNEHLGAAEDDAWDKFCKTPLADSRGGVWRIANNFAEKGQPKGWAVYCQAPGSTGFVKVVINQVEETNVGHLFSTARLKIDGAILGLESAEDEGGWPELALIFTRDDEDPENFSAKRIDACLLTSHNEGERLNPVEAKEETKEPRQQAVGVVAVAAAGARLTTAA